MKNLLLILISISLPALSTQTLATGAGEDKYHFPELEKIDSFLYWQVRGWQAVDSRSLIINISPSQSYLLILDRNVWAMKFTEQIKISSANSRVRANIDLVQVLNQVSRPGRIDAIYLLPNPATQRRVRSTILAEDFDGLIVPIIDDDII